MGNAGSQAGPQTCGPGLCGGLGLGAPPRLSCTEAETLSGEKGEGSPGTDALHSHLL